MRVLVLGRGAREHALAWKFSRSRKISGLFVAPGNAGTDEIATNLSGVGENDVETVIEQCRELQINLVFVGGETALAEGIVDRLKAEGIPTIGPGKKSAQLESSKAFSKDFMSRHAIPTAEYKTFTYLPAFEEYLDGLQGKVVIKKSGLAGGKGVLESEDREELRSFGAAVLEDDSLVVEEFLTGYELSVFALTDGKKYVLLPPCADYKKAGAGTTGPNTGGMGAVCPVPWVVEGDWSRLVEEVVEPTFRGMAADGLGYRGVLYFGLMITPEGPKVLEYNVRFGDPETQALMPLIRNDFVDLCRNMLKGTIPDVEIQTTGDVAVGVVVASDGYPNQESKPARVEGLPEWTDRLHVFHAGTRREEGAILTPSGRCFTVVGTAQDLLAARSLAYQGAHAVSFEGAWYRPDIGARIFGS
ncbi:MAG: phosphoribosylamine--glycine ligase [Spirochaetota bacterium]